MAEVLRPAAREYTVFHLFGGVGGGALGFKAAEARVGRLRASTRCLGSVDSDPRACAAFERLVGAPSACVDLFSRAQYAAFHGNGPQDGWREATVDDIRAAAGGEYPDIVFLSAPCKGFSGLNAHRSSHAKYVSLNGLTVRSIRLMLAAFGDLPPRLIVFENVPRIATVGRALLDEICGLLRGAGYSVAETTHDCGELGGLAQHRHRFLLVARHRERVPPFLYEPERRPVRTIGEVIGGLPTPTPETGGLHRLPRLQWRTWLRLALIKPGKDWRWLETYDYDDGRLLGWRLVPHARWHQGTMGVKGIGDPSVTVTGRAAPTTGAFAVGDNRLASKVSSATGRSNEYRQFGVNGMGDTAPAISSKGAGNPGGGAYSVADDRPFSEQARSKYRVTRLDEAAGAVICGDASGATALADVRYRTGFGEHSGKMRVEDASGPSHVVTGSDRVGSGALSVADVRLARVAFNDVFRVVVWGESSQAVTAGGTPSAGGLSVGDVRTGIAGRTGHSRGGIAHYGVMDLGEPARTVAAHARHDNGQWSVAAELPPPRAKCVPLIVSPWETWNRPFTTLELAALQGFDVGLLAAALDGETNTRARGWIGNAVPPQSARGVAEEVLLTLTLADAGETFRLSSRPIWVQPVSLGLSMPC